MSSTQNFFDNPMNGNGNANSGWGPALGAFLGAAVGDGGLFGGNGNNKGGNAVTPDQLGTAINGLAGNIQRDQLQESIGHLGAGNAIGFGAVKDAVVAAAGQNALALCNLGHSVTAGFAATNANIIAQGAASRELALQQALDAERARATDLRIQLSEAHNNASHTATQVMIQNLASAK